MVLGIFNCEDTWWRRRGWFCREGSDFRYLFLKTFNVSQQDQQHRVGLQKYSWIEKIISVCIGVVGSSKGLQVKREQKERKKRCPRSRKHDLWQSLGREGYNNNSKCGFTSSCLQRRGWLQPYVCINVCCKRRVNKWSPCPLWIAEIASHLNCKNKDLV